jgi:hypothetical protein
MSIKKNSKFNSVSAKEQIPEFNHVHEHNTVPLTPPARQSIGNNNSSQIIFNTPSPSETHFTITNSTQETAVEKKKSKFDIGTPAVFTPNKKNKKSSNNYIYLKSLLTFLSLKFEFIY